MLNSICGGLKFTMEKPKDFSDGWLPTLDFSLKGQGGRWTHRYFEKPMNTKWVLPHNSAMDSNSKRQILSNDLCRRISRIDPNRLEEHVAGTIN